MQQSRLQDLLNKDIVLCAEGYLFELERRGYLKAGPFVPEVVLDYPEALKEVHREFLRAGSDVMVAFTYYGHRDKMKLIGREDDLEKLNRQALRLAKEVASESDSDVLVAGNICNTWVYNPDDPKSLEEVRSIFTEQVVWAKEEGVDFIIGETFSFLGEAIIALEVIKLHGLPSVITFAPFYDKPLDCESWEEACRVLEEKGADVVGLNCAAGPDTMMPIVKRIKEKVNCPIAALPVPYGTNYKESSFQRLKGKDGKKAFPVNLDPFMLTREETADFAVKAKEIGIKYIGLCCGAGPHHIRSMAEALGRTVPSSKYSPDMSKHAMLGSDDVVKDHNKPFRDGWKK